MVSFCEKKISNNIKRGQDIHNVDELSVRIVLFLIKELATGEHFSDKALFDFLKKGILLRWLKRLRNIDENIKEKDIKQISFSIRGYFEGYQNYCFVFHEKGQRSHHKTNEVAYTKKYNQKESRDILANFKSLHTED